MKKARQVERVSRGAFNVKLQLFGWPAEQRRLSVVEAQWFVQFTFNPLPSWRSYSITYFTSEDYDAALAKYEALKVIFEV